MKLFGSHEPVFGLDIGHQTLKVAVANVHGNTAHIVSTAEIAIPKGSKTSRGIKDKDVIAQKVKEAKEQAQPKRIELTSCASALPESLVFTKVIELPKMTSAEIARAMPYQIAHSFPIPLEEAYFDWAILGPGPSPDTLEALVVAAPKILVEDFVDIVEKSGSNLVSLETKPVALTRLFAKPGMKGGTIIADIGAIVTGIYIVADGNLRLTATVNIGAEQLDQDPSGQSIIAGAVKNLVKYHANRLREKAEFTTVSLCGGGANLKGTPQALAKELNIPVTVGKPALLIQGYDPKYATAIGLALRGSL